MKEMFSKYKDFSVEQLEKEYQSLKSARNRLMVNMMEMSAEDAKKVQELTKELDVIKFFLLNQEEGECQS